MLEAYHLTLPCNVKSILKKGMKKGSYWFPNSLFPGEWKSSGLKDSLLEYFSIRNKKSVVPLAIIMCELMPCDKAFVQNLYNTFTDYEIRQSVSIDYFLKNNPDFRVPEIMVKNKIMPGRISLAGYVENWL